MSEFSDSTLKLLQDAGWSENYLCKIVGFISPNDDLECSPSNVVLHFMQRFGELKIGMHERSVNRAFPIEFLKNPICEDFSHFAKRLNLESPLMAYVIGTAYSGHVELFMTENGQVLGHFDSLLWKFGDSGMEAIENLCHDRIAKIYD
jgi:hypothetical protein